MRNGGGRGGRRWSRWPPAAARLRRSWDAAAEPPSAASAHARHASKVLLLVGSVALPRLRPGVVSLRVPFALNALPDIKIKLAPGVDSENDYKLLEQRTDGISNCTTEEFQTLRNLPFILHIINLGDYIKWVMITHS